MNVRNAFSLMPICTPDNSSTEGYNRNLKKAQTRTRTVMKAVAYLPEIK